MSIKEELLQKHNLDPRNTGHPAAQFILLQAETKLVIEHLRANRKDIPAKRSMLKKIARQKHLLSDLKKLDYQLYLTVAKNLHQGRKSAKIS